LKESYKYKAFGLKIESEFAIPEFHSAKFERAEININYGKNPNQISGMKDHGVLYQAKKDDFLLRLDTVGSFRVQSGRNITVERINNATDQELRLFLLGSAFGALIHQRGLLPLHGSTIIHKDQAISICGVSGAGKSTLAAALQKRGYTLLADDITAIDIKNGKAWAFPGIPHLKLWEDVLKKMDEDPSSLDRLRPQLKKYRKPVIKNKSEHPVELQTIIILSSRNKETFNLEEITGAEKFSVLKNNTYRSQFIVGLETAEKHFKLVAQLASHAKVYKIERPNSPLLIDELADFFSEKAPYM